MGPKWLSICAFLSYALLQCVLGEVTFTSSPGIIRTDGTQPVRLVWTLSQLRGYEIGHISKDNVKILVNMWGTSIFVNGYNNSKLDFNMDTHSERITVTISDISEDDAGQYSCYHTPSGQALITNDDAVIYLYGKPMKPNLPVSPIDIVAGRDLELTCNSSSTSMPTGYRQPLQYTWFNKNEDITSSPPDRHHISGNRLTLQKVHSADAANSYRCQAYEAGGLTSDNSSILQLSVLYKPSAAQLQVDTQTSLTEKEDELSLTCELNDPGNPEPEYQWQNLDAGFRATTQMNKNLVISAADLTVGRHDGRWQCWGENTVGQGEKSPPIHIIINAGPQVQENLPSHRNVSIRETLSVTCSFKAKPPAQVMWRYSGSTEDLPPGVVSNNQDQPQGKYTVTSSTLYWSSSSTETDRREAAGSYTCHASNSMGAAPSSSMSLDVQYGPYGLQTEPAGMSLIYNETQQVSISCRADCNPRCSFTWTRDRSNQWMSNGYRLNIDSVSRTHFDRYTCNASNEVDSKSLYVDISVNYRPQIKSFQHSASGIDVMQGTEVHLTCSVDSQPGSTIDLLESDVSLKVEQDAQILYYTFPSIHVTNSSTYQCAASNLLGPIPPASKYLELDVKGPFEKCSDPDTNISKPLNGSLILEICLTANPFPPIIESDWNFVSDDSNTSSSSDLPGQVAITSIERNHKYQRIIQLEIKRILKIHYGAHSLRKNNQYGPADDKLFTFKLQPKGPPESPYDLDVVGMNASSIHLSWRAGFSGGPRQTFWLKVVSSSGSIHTVKISGHTDVTSLDLVEFTLLAEHGIQPSETYKVTVGAVNRMGKVTGAEVQVTTPDEMPTTAAGLSTNGRTIVITAVTSIAATSLIAGLAWMIAKRQRRRKQRPEAAVINELPAPATEQRSTPSHSEQYEVCAASEPTAPAFYEPLPKEDEYEDVRSIQGHHNTGAPESSIQDVYLTTKADVVYYNIGGDVTKPRDLTTEPTYTEVVD